MSENDPFWEGLFKICSLYRENKETVSGMLDSFKTPVSILSSMYCYLVARQEIDPIDDTDNRTRARYLLNIL